MSAGSRPRLDSAAESRRGPPPPPKRNRPAPQAEPASPPPSAKAAASSAALAASIASEDFASGEPATLALSRPIPMLLDEDSALTESVTPPTPTLADPMPSVETIQTESPASVTAVELETAAARAQLASTPRLRSSSAKKQTALLVTACVLAGALLGTRAWVRSHGTAWLTPHAAVAALPKAMPPADVEPTAAPAPSLAEAPADVKPTAAPAPNPDDAPAPAATSTAVAAAVESTAVPHAAAPLLAVDGSERPAPTCDDLLANVASEGEKAFDHVRAARQALIRGDFDGSQRGFCRAIRAGQAETIATSELAQVLILRRDAAAAVSWARATVRLDPSSPRALTLLGDALVRTGNLDEARQTWLAASKLAEGDRTGIDGMVQAALVAADGALKERDPARAERLLRKVIAFQPENAAAHAKLGVALTRLGFAQSAEAWTKRAAELSAAQ